MTTVERRLLIDLRAHLAAVEACPRCVDPTAAHDDCHSAAWHALRRRLDAVLRVSAEKAPS